MHGGNKEVRRRLKKDESRYFEAVDGGNFWKNLNDFCQEYIAYIAYTCEDDGKPYKVKFYGNCTGYKEYKRYNTYWAVIFFDEQILLF